MFEFVQSLAAQSHGPIPGSERPAPVTGNALSRRRAGGFGYRPTHHLLEERWPVRALPLSPQNRCEQWRPPVSSAFYVRPTVAAD